MTTLMMCDSAASMISPRTVTIKKPAAKKSVTRVIEPVVATPSHSAQLVDHPPAHAELIHQVDNMIRGEIAGGKFNQQEAAMLEHLGEYVEEPYTLIESYFRGQHLERLVRHQIESYNHFINYQIQRTIEMFNPVVIRSENDYVADRGQYFLEAHVSFDNFKLYPPQIHENNGATKMMLPQEAKLRNFTYASTMTVDVKIKYIVRNTEAMDTPKIITKTLPKINIGKMPIMLKSSICVLAQNRHIQSQYTGECPMDCGGYFIIKGSEKTVLGQERAAENRVYCFDGRNNAKWNWIAEIKSIPDFKCISPKQIEMMIASKNGGFGHGIYVNIPRIKQPIELFVVFRALGVLSDREICEYILLNVDEHANRDLLAALQGSIVEANKYLTEEDALRHITAYAAYTPMNMDRETGQNKKREFTLEVLNNDLFPHCQTMPQKIMMLGYMANKLIQTSLGWLPCDDRDSYLNKRIDLTGTLLNNLFRNYFNKLVKEMQKQVVREINGGSWRSTEDYENIINMTNIYKIMKSTTIENGITRALSTGDFSIKQANSSKVGVAQVLNRLTYVASLSHLRRVNTPLEKSGELIAPRKLHNTTWGFLCLTGDAEVLLSDRVTIKKIKDMKDGDCVTTVNPETLCDEPSEIHSFFRKMPDKLFEITTISGRKIKATANHPFLVNVNGKGEWKNLEDLNAGYDQVIMHHTGFRNQPNDNIYMHDGVNILNNGCVSVPILSITEIEPEFVYDFTTMSENHSFVASSFVVHNCPAETPEGQSIGVVKNISYMSHITIPTKSSSLYEYVEPYIKSVDAVRPPELYGKVKVFVNGTWVGVCENPHELYESMKDKKYRGIINIYTAVVFDYKLMEIRICNDGGRLTRPLLRVRNNKAMITPEIIAKVDKHELSWNDLLTSCRIDESVIEYIDPEEQNHSMVAMKTKHGYLGENATYNYTHCEIHPSTIFGVLASCIPFPEHNQAPRNTYQCAMAKQAIGVYALNYDQRMDKTAYVLSYPSRPLVDTRLMNFIHLNQIPSGCQIHVAIMTHTGYNQEDSVLVNKGSIDRGLFSATIYHTEKDEDKNIIRDEIIRCKPDKTKTKGIKFGNYDKVNNQGFIPENTLVENRDVIIAKIIPIKENRNDPTKTIKYEDQSKTFRTTEETYIDKNYTGRNGDGYNFAKVRVRVHRKPGYGDKFSSRHGQKGTCGNIIPECDMPFTKNGLRPDIIINPHAIPSRMTIAQLKETLLGKVLLEVGMLGDGTSFGNLDIKTIIQELQKLGYESHGNEVMYNGLTGEQLETSIFIGPVFYQRLKHMVADKQHSRAIGPMVNLTRQPAEGRSRDGGFRIGEMERDVMIAHGMSKFCRERLYDVSDKYSTHVCRKCGMIASYNDGNLKKGSDFSVHLCNTCNNMTDFAKVDIPYAYKLMSQELQAINVVPRLITE
uniref:DNA-directed RNA polymerase n=1 Tax=viral metagenome TaxID=1070528 RepID=A0A6C0KGT0_9ZZZZ